MAFVTVAGRLLASHFQAGGEVPLSGQIFFTPTMEKVPTGEGVHFPAPTSVELDGEGRFEVELLSAGFSWEVGFSLRHAGAFVPVDCFSFLPTPGVDRVNFSEILPLTDPVTSQPMLRGEDGVGVSAITTAGGELIFTLTNGSESRIPVPQGVPGTGVDNITLEGDELVFALSDGSEERLPAPKGTPGVAGVGISTITLVDGELVFTLTDGAEYRLPAPKGEPGEPGVSPPAPTLSVGNVATLPTGANATAEITGTSPDYALTLGIPQGAPGAKGDKGDDGDTPTITAGTVSTLPAGASATADMVPTTDGYVLNLGLPAGAPGAPGKDAPTPTLAVGTVNTGTASASITGTAPNYTLNLTLPTGAKGETGNPSTMTLVGAGRPDTPATLSSTNQSAVSSAPVGATFTSTDGAGTGAWAWVKTPAGWEPTYADTGWRDVTSLCPVTSGFVHIRRVGYRVSYRFGLTVASAGFLQEPTGFIYQPGPATNHYPANIALPVAINASLPEMITVGYFNRFAGNRLQFPGNTKVVSGLYDFYVSHAWPSTLPGTPA